MLIDGGFRWKNEFQDKSLYVIRTGIAYEIRPGIRIAAGFAHTGTFSSDTISKMEFRPYQEMTYKKQYNKIRIDQRFRIEERIFQAISQRELTGPAIFYWRFRYQFQLNFPIWKFCEKDPNRYLSFSISEELFINAGEKAKSWFDMNRIVCGPVFHLNDRLNFSLSYNAQFATGTMPKKHQYTSVAWFTIRQKISLKEK